MGRDRKLTGEKLSGKNLDKKLWDFYVEQICNFYDDPIGARKILEKYRDRVNGGLVYVMERMHAKRISSGSKHPLEGLMAYFEPSASDECRCPSRSISHALGSNFFD